MQKALRETGEFSFPDGGRMSIAVFRHIIATAVPPEQGSGLRA
jgi:hypothetical protein